ncbi:MAG: S1 RNA-binding domain-containing protein [Planctomycetota bacterium]
MSDSDTSRPRVDLDDKLSAEIEAALGDMSIEDMVDTPSRPQMGRGGGSSRGKSERQVRQGIVANVRGDDVYVEFGPKTQGICNIQHFDEPPKTGDQMEFFLDRYDDSDGMWVLSRRGKVQKAEWESLEVGQVVEARCTGTNKGGLEMEIANHRAFMPAGQVDLRHVADLAVFVGEKMPCEVMEIDRNRARIILSRKTVLNSEREEMRGKLMADLQVGKTMPAVITSVQEYGAFADLGGIDGLIHISDMSHSRLKHPKEAVKEGDQVQVQVLKIDTKGDQTRIGLGMKQLEADPYEATTKDIAEGATVSGRVTKIMDFGAFVELAPGVEGLIHISELSHERVHKVQKVVQVDQVVTVKVLSIDAAARRISLSLKALSEKAEAETSRNEDPELRKLKAMLGKKFGDNLKGGLG